MATLSTVVFTLAVIAATISTTIQEDITHEDFCPPLGKTGEKHRANIVLKTASEYPISGGCISKELIANDTNGDSRFNLWVGPIGTAGYCDDLDNMIYFQFSCISSRRVVSENGRSWMYMKLHDGAGRIGRLAERCAIYERVANSSKSFMRFALNDSPLCDGIGERLARPRHNVPLILMDHWTDEAFGLYFDSVEQPLQSTEYNENSTGLVKGDKPLKLDAIILSPNGTFNIPGFLNAYENINQDRNYLKNFLIGRFRRSVDSFRFPDWAQGCWVKLCIDGDKAIFDSIILFENDDVEGGLINVDMKSTGDAHRIRRDLSHIFGLKPNSSESGVTSQYDSAHLLSAQRKKGTSRGEKIARKFKRRFRIPNVDNYMMDLEEQVKNQSIYSLLESKLNHRKNETKRTEMVKHPYFDRLMSSWNQYRSLNDDEIIKLPSQAESKKLDTFRDLHGHDEIEMWRNMLDLDKFWKSEMIIFQTRPVPDDFITALRELETALKDKTNMRVTAATKFRKIFKKFMGIDDLAHLLRKVRSTEREQPSTKYVWRSVMLIDTNDNNQIQKFVKVLVKGGQVDDVATREKSSDTLTQTNDDNNTMYGCMMLVLRDVNLIEFTILDTGMLKPNQDLTSFAQDLCSENKTTGSDGDVRSEPNRPHQLRWITETRANETDRKPVSCPIPSGTVFYGEMPPTPPAKDKLCVRLVSAADDCGVGKVGPADRLKFTISECVPPATSAEETTPEPINTRIYEASRGYTNDRGGSWRRSKRDGDGPTSATHVVTSAPQTADSTVISTTTSSTPIDRSTAAAETTSHRPTTTVSSTTAETTSHRPTTTVSSTTAATPIETSTWSSQHERQEAAVTRTAPTPVPSPTGPATTTADVDYRPRQQWQPPNENGDHYDRGRQQYYPPPPPGSTSVDYNDYHYRQRQGRQQWQQQPQWPSPPPPQWTPPPSQPQWTPPPPQSQWTPPPQRQPNNNGGGRRTDDYYYRHQQQQQQQQQTYHHHQQYNNNNNNNYNQQQTTTTTTPMLFGAGSGGWRNASIAPNAGGWNVYGDRPLYVSSGGGGDVASPPLWNNGTSDGGWTTAAQQHWWYRQQQLQVQQQRQQQNARGGILSLPPVPLPPLDQSNVVAVSTAVPSRPPPPPPPQPQPPQPPRRPQKPPNHYYQPTPSTSLPNRLQPKSESRYYEEGEYQCIGQWSETQIASATGKRALFTYTYVQKLGRSSAVRPEYECFVVTAVPNDPGQDPRVTTVLLRKAGKGPYCNRQSDPFDEAGMKAIVTKNSPTDPCAVAMPAGGKSWFPLKPQQISPANGEGKWYASPPVSVYAPSPTTVTPIVTGKHTGGNGVIPRQHQTRRPPPKVDNGNNKNVGNSAVIAFLFAIAISVWMM